jgi:Uma2 family endonuclease
MQPRRARIRFTYRDYLLLPEEKRYELIEGELFMVPSPGLSHQKLVGKLYRLLSEFVEGRNLGVVIVGPFDVVLSEEDVVQPDILFLSGDRIQLLTERNLQGPPDLVIEVLSPATAQRDRELKGKLYARAGVQEYWLVDPQERSIQVLVLREEGYQTAGIYREGSSLTSPLLPGLKLEVVGVFAA